MQELPENILWLEDGDRSRHVHKYERRPYEAGEVATFYDYDPADATGAAVDFDTAVTCRVTEDETLGLIGRLV